MKGMVAQAKLSIDTSLLCAVWLNLQGDAILASCRPPHGGYESDAAKKIIKRITGDRWYALGAPNAKANKAHNIQWFGGGIHYRWLTSAEDWDYGFTYWSTGGHDRNFKLLMQQLPDENQQQVNDYKKEVTYKP